MDVRLSVAVDVNAEGVIGEGDLSVCWELMTDAEGVMGYLSVCLCQMLRASSVRVT